MREFLAWLTASSEAENKLRAALRPGDVAEFTEACALLAQLGWTADDVKKIAHAATYNRILAFGWGEVIDIGERGLPTTGNTRGTKTWEQEQP